MGFRDPVFIARLIARKSYHLGVPPRKILIRPPTFVLGPANLWYTTQGTMDRTLQKIEVARHIKGTYYTRIDFCRDYLCICIC